MTRRHAATTGLLVVWAAAGVVAGAGLMRPHWVPLPVPTAAVTAAGPPDAAGTWTALHALQADCGCSRRVLEHLRSRPPVAGVRERILWVTDAAAAPAACPDGYEVEALDGAALAERYGVEAAPVLTVLAPDGTARYRGGYTRRKQGYEIRDQSIIRETVSGDPPPHLPVYGCPVSDRLRRTTTLFPSPNR